MKAPASYADWSACIDVLEAASNDEAIIQVMAQGSLSWTSGVAELFSERISGAFNTRLQQCADRMNRDLGQGANETTLIHAMLATRRSLSLLHRAGEIPAFPQTLKDHLCSEVKRYAEQTQKSLEESARHDRSGRLTSVIRHNNLLAYANPSNTTAPIESDRSPLNISGTDASSNSRKRTILT
jgi:hypothetical protein